MKERENQAGRLNGTILTIRTTRLQAAGFTTLDHLVELAGHQLQNSAALAIKVGLRSHRAQLILSHRRRKLTGHVLQLLSFLHGWPCAKHTGSFSWSHTDSWPEGLCWALPGLGKAFGKTFSRWWWKHSTRRDWVGVPTLRGGNTSNWQKETWRPAVEDPSQSGGGELLHLHYQ